MRMDRLLFNTFRIVHRLIDNDWISEIFNKLFWSFQAGGTG